MKMIIGLGNPGKDYERTRHNIGFMVIDNLSKTWGITVTKKECQALTGKGFFNHEQILLVKPQTFMNNSGQAVGELIHYYDTIDDFIVVHDDMDLPVGRIRFKRRGSAGGHNGIKSIISHLNSNEFDRLKIGIGHDLHGRTVNHVLSGFYKEEAEAINSIIDQSDKMLAYWVENGITMTMNEYN